MAASATYRYLKILLGAKYYIILSMVTVTVAAAVFSGPSFITPMFRSETIIYPPATNSNRMLIERDARFGSDKEIDEQIQLLRSGVVRDSIISMFKLYEHYNIDSAASDKKYLMYQAYDDRVKIDRTRYNSISIAVSDQEPGYAAKMANELVALSDRLKERIIKEKLREAFDALAASMFDLSLEIDQLAEEINQQYGKTVVSGSAFQKQGTLQQLKEQLDVKELMGQARQQNATRKLEILYYYEAKLQQASTLQLSYDQALVSLNNQIPSSFVISPAEVSDKKYYPIRWMITVIAAIASFVVACGSIIVVTTFRSVLSEIKS